jgi:DNA-binding MarR family transcriptional regulator/ribosomal protein S18 acetylase RimI-like enzyme
MGPDEIYRVREFNRTVTQRIGVLNDEYLSRGRALGASRVLWEVGPDGVDVRMIRARLGLDSGYLSRLLRNLEGEGLITTEADASDQRVRVIQLTKAGRAERAELDRRSDELAASLLAPLDGERSRQLLDAMATVERLLTAGLVEFQVEDPVGPVATFCLQSYFAELETRFDNGFDPGLGHAANLTVFSEPTGLMLVAYVRGTPIGCGGLKFHDDQPADLKRMWVAKSARGLGVGRRLLTELEQRARDHGAHVVRLETNKSLTEAINLYRSTGYTEIAGFNDEPYAHHWFEKHIEVERSLP